MPGPPMPNTAREAEFRQQFFDLFAYSANLTDVQKVDAEFWVLLVARSFSLFLSFPR